MCSGMDGRGTAWACAGYVACVKVWRVVALPGRAGHVACVQLWRAVALPGRVLAMSHVLRYGGPWHCLDVCWPCRMCSGMEGRGTAWACAGHVACVQVWRAVALPGRVLAMLHVFCLVWRAVALPRRAGHVACVEVWWAVAQLIWHGILPRRVLSIFANKFIKGILFWMLNSRKLVLLSSWNSLAQTPSVKTNEKQAIFNYTLCASCCC